MRKQVSLLLLTGLFMMTVHPFIHVYQNLSPFNEVTFQETPDKNGESENYETCLACVLVSYLSCDDPDHSLCLPENSDFFEKEVSFLNQMEIGYGFSLRAPPLPAV